MYDKSSGCSPLVNSAGRQLKSNGSSCRHGMRVSVAGLRVGLSVAGMLVSLSVAGMRVGLLRVSLSVAELMSLYSGSLHDFNGEDSSEELDDGSSIVSLLDSPMVG